MIRRFLLCLAALVPAVALAEDGIDYGSIDGFLVPLASVRAGWPAPGGPVAVSDEGKGFGVRVLSRATEQLMVGAEFQHLAFDDLSLNQVRLTAGLALPSTTGVYLSYDRLDLDLENGNALGLRLRTAGRVAGPVSLYGEAGYLGVDADSFYYDGFEFTAGATWDLPEPWGLFVDYRATLLDDHERDDKLHREELRLGVRFRFDC